MKRIPFAQENDPTHSTINRPATLPNYDPSLSQPLLLVSTATVFILVFVTLGSEVMEGETRTFDMSLLHWAQALRVGHSWLADVMRDLSGMGSTVVLTLVIAATAGYLVLTAARATALLVVTSALSGTLLVSIFKAAFGRARPDLAYADFLVPSLSFPSGHASMSAVVYLTLGALIAGTRPRLAQRVYIFTTAALMTTLVGLSRVALGVHWATDVLGGWAFGAAWAIIWLLLARRISREHTDPTGAARRHTEGPPKHPTDLPGS